MHKPTAASASPNTSNNNATNTKIQRPNIKHIVVGGGGTTGFMTLGALKFLQDNKFWDISNIKTVYGTSIGSIAATCIALKYDWETLLTYFIRRPWNKLYAYNKSEMVLNLYNQKGIFKRAIFEKTLYPLLEGRGLSGNITMKELFEYSKIDIHFFSLELNSMTKTDLSYKTHPDLRVVDAIYMSSACPILFSPCIDEASKTCYVDGGLICNYPVNECIENEKCIPDEILGMRNIFEHYVNPVTESTSVFEYFTSIYKQVTMYALNEQSYQPIQNEVVCITDNSGTDFVRWIDALKSDNIIALMNKGEMYARLFMKYKGHKTNIEITQCGTRVATATAPKTQILIDDIDDIDSGSDADDSRDHGSTHSDADDGGLGLDLHAKPSCKDSCE
jgi:predicted acylesterase/phospholipase RssA